MFLYHQVGVNDINIREFKNTQKCKKIIRQIENFIEREIRDREENNDLSTVDTSDLTPLEYEHYCADILRHCGWSVQMTPATRDGGADFIAEKGRNRLVAQCKRYAQPVGNKAVQEVHSAVRLYHGTAACVIAPMGFTSQARREAHGLSVALLHHSALKAFAEKFDAHAPENRSIIKIMNS